MSDVQERILSDVGQDPQKGEAAVLEALGWLAAGLTVLIDSHSLDHLPTRKAVIRMLRQGEQALARYGDLRENAGREERDKIALKPPYPYALRTAVQRVKATVHRLKRELQRQAAKSSEWKQKFRSTRGTVPVMAKQIKALQQEIAAARLAGRLEQAERTIDLYDRGGESKRGWLMDELARLRKEAGRE